MHVNNSNYDARGFILQLLTERGSSSALHQDGDTRYADPNLVQAAVSGEKETGAPDEPIYASIADLDDD